MPGRARHVLRSRTRQRRHGGDHPHVATASRICPRLALLALRALRADGGAVLDDDEPVIAR